MGVFAGAFAQEFPSRSVKMIVPLTPGSGADVVGRIVAKYMGASWKQPVVVDNRPGAGGQIGTQAVIQSAPDGYTVMVQSASHAANSAIYKSLPYDPLKDLIDVAILGMTPYVMVSNPNGPYRSLKALIDAAKAQPEKIPFASAGVGSSTHLTAEYFAQAAGIKMLHIPYKGSPEAIRDSAAGLTSFYMAPINTAIGLIKDKKVAALGVSSSRRSAALPDVPTIAEQGVAGFSMTLWFGMWAPAGTPAPVIQKLNAEVSRILQLPEVREQYGTLGVEPVTMPVAEFAKFVRDEMATYQRIVKDANIQQQ
jgi:tripartite-type tricarboxylate transporter receptor subunit TctC